MILDDPEQATDVESLGRRLSRLGYRCTITNSLGGGDGQDCLKNLRHKFLTCTAPGTLRVHAAAHSPPHTRCLLRYMPAHRTHTTCAAAAPGSSQARQQYVVDPVFKDQFEIAKPTPRYAALLASLPDDFVGPMEHVIPLVSFLCSEIAAAFQEEGTLLPPWRQASSMLSKWRPRRSSEENVMGDYEEFAPPALGLRDADRTTASQGEWLPQN